VGGRDYGATQFNRAVNGLRQPGSAFKPFVYAAAVAESIPANAIVADTALAVPLDGGRVYRPSNADDLFLGELTMREALVRSRNPVAVQLALAIGMDTVAALAHRLGIDTPISRYPSSAIGASVVRPLDLVAAYAAFANGGAAVEPRFVHRQVGLVDERSGETLSIPIKHGEGRFWAPEEMLDQIEERDAQLLDRRERELHLPLDAAGAGDAELRPRDGCVLEQRGLADARLPVHHERPAGPAARGLQHAVDRLALALPPEQLLGRAPDR